MNWEAIGAIGEIVGALSVLITLIYLATQVREAKKATHLQTEDAVLSAWNETSSHAAESLEKADIFVRGLNDYSALDGAERVIFHFMCDRYVVEHQRGKNLFEKDGWDWNNRNEIESTLVMLLKSPGGAQWWAEAKIWYMHRDYLDQIVADAEGLPELTNMSMFKRSAD